MVRLMIAWYMWENQYTLCELITSSVAQESICKIDLI